MKQHRKWLAGFVPAFVAAALALGIAPANALASSFSDVSNTIWYLTPVEWANAAGAMTGYADGTFGPDDALTRGQAATILYRYLGNGEITEDSGKSDVAQDEYYTAAVNWAVKHHVMNGYGDSNNFGPNDSLTREQAAVILANATQADLDTTKLNRTAYDKLANTDEADDYAVSSLIWATDKGIINGVNGTDLAPTATVTRAEMATMLKNANDKGILSVPEAKVKVTAEVIGVDADGNAEVWAPETTYEVQKGTDAWSVFEQLLDATPGLSADASTTTFGTYVSSITKDGRTLAYDSATGAYWQFYVNDSAADLGVSSTFAASDGTSFVFAYTKWGDPVPTVA